MQTLSCGRRDLVPQPGIEPQPPALGARRLSHWTTREVPTVYYVSYFSFCLWDPEAPWNFFYLGLLASVAPVPSPGPWTFCWGSEVRQKAQWGTGHCHRPHCGAALSHAGEIHIRCGLWKPIVPLVTLIRQKWPSLGRSREYDTWSLAWESLLTHLPWVCPVLTHPEAAGPEGLLRACCGGTQGQLHEHETSAATQASVLRRAHPQFKALLSPELIFNKLSWSWWHLFRGSSGGLLSRAGRTRSRHTQRSLCYLWSPSILN